MAAKKNPASKPASAAADDEGVSFEDALERLETIVEELEGGALTLEQSLARYEEGIRLSRRLTQTLDHAEKRIERLTETEGGEAATVPMDLEEGEGETVADSPRPARASERVAGGARARPAAPPPVDELPF